MRNYTITKIWGIPIRLNISLLVFLPILAWLIGSGQQIEVYAGFIEGLTGAQFDLARLWAGNTSWIIGLAAAIGLFISVTLHELGHSWVSLRYGIEISSLVIVSPSELTSTSSDAGRLGPTTGRFSRPVDNRPPYFHRGRVNILKRHPPGRRPRRTIWPNQLSREQHV